MRSADRAALLTLAFLVATVATASSWDSESYYRYYYKQKIPMIADSQSIAVYDSDQGPPGDLHSLLRDAGYAGSELKSYPVPGWSIAFIRSASGTTPVSGVNPIISWLLGFDRLSRYFFSPIFADSGGEPLLIAPCILVRFKKGVSQQRVLQLLEIADLRGAQPTPFGGMENSFKLSMENRSGVRVLEAANRLAELPEVIYAEPDLVITGQTSLTPTDPLFNESWGLHNTGQEIGAVADIDIDAPEAWDHGTGDPSTIVVVFDSGVQHDHPDINQIPGKDFTSQPSPQGDGRPGNVCDRHGTIVAGVISGKLNNSIGTVGVAPNARVASARVIISGLSCSSSHVFTQSSWIIDALQWAEGIGARVTNHSYTFNDPIPALSDEFQYAYAKGLLHFAGAGNDPTKPVQYPANLPVVNAISAIDWDGARSSFSAFGTEIAFAAPGSRILTTDRTGSAGYGAGDYVVMDGTSLASPMAAGVAALLLGRFPGLSPADVESILRETAVDLGPSGRDDSYGWGLVNANNALTYLLVFEDGFETGDTSAWSSTIR